MKRAAVPVRGYLPRRSSSGGRAEVAVGHGLNGARLTGLGEAGSGRSVGGLGFVLLRGGRPPLLVGAVVTLLLVALCTTMIYPLKQVTPVSSLGVVYLLGVVLVSTFWGIRAAVAMSVLSAAAFNFFHLAPVDRFTLADTRNWVALGTFLVVAVASSSVAAVARKRAVEAERRRAEADLTAEMAQQLLSVSVEDALAVVGQRLAGVFELPWASLTQGEMVADSRHEVIAMRAGDRRLGSLLIPAGQPPAVVDRLRERMVPALAAVLAVGLERERLVAEAVRTEGIARSEAVKTAILRAVSHDLRSPVMAIMAAGTAVRGHELSREERDELGSLVVEESARLSRMIEDLLDLSKLEAHAAMPALAECSAVELIDAALAAQPPQAAFEVGADRDLPLVCADFGQIERALANLLENAIRYSAGEPVLIRAQAIGRWVRIRVVDHGPGIAGAEQERIFEPFYRGEGAPGNTHAGSGLGLGIARGFVEANGGRICVESTPGHGSTFVITLPVVSEP